MLAELSIEPLGKSDHVSAPIARVVDLIAESGLDYQVTAMGTLVEGDSQRVWDLVRRCHELAREGCGRVITQIRIDERSNGGPALHRSVERVEKVLGKPVHKSA
jgi:uncharacterized protein (TIGR00106 family)